MTFWSRVGDIAEGAWKVAGKVGDVTTYPTRLLTLGTIWGASKASGDDDTAKTVGSALAESTAAAGASLNTPYRYGVARPLSTVAQVSQGALYGNGGAQGDRTWKKAWENSDTQSLGQSFTNFYGAGLNRQRQIFQGETEAEVNADAERRSKSNSLMNITRTDMTADERKDWFTHTNGGKFTSGTVDFTANVLLDPLNLVPGGKGADLALRSGEKVDDALKLVREGTADLTGGSRLEATAATGTDQRTNYVAAKIHDFLKSTDDKSVSQLMNQQQFKSSADAGALASAFSEANKIADPAARLQAKVDIYGVGMGDQASMDSLRAQRADLAESLDKLTKPNEITNAPTFVGSGDGTLAAMNNDEALKALDARREDLTTRLDQAERLWAVKGTVSRFDQDPLAAFSAGRQDARTREMIYQDGSLSRPIRFITNATAKSAPGYINVHDTSFGAMALRDTLAQSKRIKSEDKAALLDAFIKAPTAAGRAQVVRQAEAHLWSGMPTNENIAKALKGHTTWPATKDELIARAEESGASSDVVDAIRTSKRDAFEDLDDVARHTDTVDSKTVMAAYGAAAKRSTGYINQMKTRSFSANENVGPEYSSLVDEEGIGTVFHGPFMRSQLENSVKLSDPKMIEDAFKRITNKGSMRGIQDASAEAKAMHDEVLSWLTQRWKDASLMRLAYPVRVQVDTQLRLMAMMQGQYFISAAMGLKNLSINRFGGKVDDMESLTTHALALQRRQHMQAELDRHLAKADPTTTVRVGPGGSTKEEFTAAGGDPDEWERFATDNEVPDLAAKAERNKQVNDLRAEIGRVSETVNQPIKQVRQGKQTHTRRRTGGINDKASYKGFDLRAARSVQEQEVIDRVVQGDNALAVLGQELMDRDMRHYKSTGEFDVLTGSNPGWAPAYKRALNYQIANSPVAMQTLRGSSMEELRKFVRTNADAANEWSQFRAQYQNNLDEWLNHIDEHLITTVPSSKVREALVAKGKISDQDIKDWYGNTADRPPVHGEAFTPFVKSVASRKYEDFRQGYYKWANEIPENVMGRHPLFVHSYQNNLKDMIDRIGSDTIDSTTFEELRKTASAMARKDISETLFDMSHSTNLAHMFRFISPFYSAWEDTMTKWGKLFYDDPKRAVVMNKVWQAPDKSGLVQEDQNGNKVIVLPKKFGAGLAGGHWTFRKDSFNIVFQGSNFWNPGVGPLVQVPVNELVKKHFPEIADSWVMSKTLLPYGLEAEGPATQVLPAWMKRVYSATGHGDDYGNTYAMLAAQEQTSYEQGKRKSEPTSEEIGNRTRNWYLMRAMVNNASPVSATPSPRLQFYVDQAHAYARKYAGQVDANGKRINWQQKYYDDFPEYFNMAVSLSENTTGIDATDKAWKASQKYRDKIADDPEYGWFYAGADNVGGDFSKGVYAAQQADTIAGGTDKTWRTRKDPAEALKDIQVSKGWIEYNKVGTAINTALEQRGLHSTSQKGAEDILATKQAFVAALGEQNPEWRDAYGQRDGSKVADFLNVATKAMASDKTLANRPDNQALQAYIQVRKAFKAKLKERGLSKLPGDGTKGATDNADLLAVWNAFTQGLVSNDIGFEQQYNRVLEGDDLSGDF